MDTHDVGTASHKSTDNLDDSKVMNTRVVAQDQNDRAGLSEGLQSDGQREILVYPQPQEVQTTPTTSKKPKELNDATIVSHVDDFEDREVQDIESSSKKMKSEVSQSIS
jgi:hypothetical protein